MKRPQRRVQEFGVIWGSPRDSGADGEPQGAASRPNQLRPPQGVPCPRVKHAAAETPGAAAFSTFVGVFFFRTSSISLHGWAVRYHKTGPPRKNPDERLEKGRDYLTNSFAMTNDPFPLARYCPTELSVMLETLCIVTIRHGSCQPHVATEHLEWG